MSDLKSNVHQCPILPTERQAGWSILLSGTPLMDFRSPPPDTLPGAPDGHHRVGPSQPHRLFAGEGV